MGRSKKNGNSKRKHNESKTAARNASNTPEVYFDREETTECNQRSNDEIKRSGHSSQTPLEGTPANEIEDRSEGIGTDCLQTRVSDIVDNILKPLLEAVRINKCLPELVSKAMEKNLSSTPYQEYLNSVHESHRDLFEYSKLHSPKLIEGIAFSLIIQNQQTQLQILSNIISQARTSGLLSIEAKAEAFEALTDIRLLEELKKDSDVQDTTGTDNVEDEVNKIVTYLVKKKKNNVQANNGDFSNDNIKKNTNSTHKSTKGNKDARGSTSRISKAEKSPYNIELGYEEDTKTTDDIESMAEAKACNEMTQTNEMVNLCANQNKDEENLSKMLQFILINFIKDVDSENAENFRSLYLIKEQLVFLSTENAESIQDANALKELADELNDIIITWRIEKGTNIDASNYNQVAGKSTEIITENKKKGQKGNEDTDITNVNFQNVHSNKETIKFVRGSENSMLKEKDIPEERHTNKDNKIISPVKAKIKPPCSIKEYLMQQKAKYCEQAKIYRDKLSELKPIKEQQDSISSEKGLATVEKTESCSENKFKTDRKGEAIKEVMSAQLEDSRETIVQMNEYNIINFKFDTYRNRFIYTLDNKVYFPMNKKQPFTFRFRDEDIQVCFSGENIFSSTKNREFDVYIRKSTTVNATDEDTETDK